LTENAQLGEPYSGLRATAGDVGPYAGVPTFLRGFPCCPPRLSPPPGAALPRQAGPRPHEGAALPANEPLPHRRGSD